MTTTISPLSRGNTKWANQLTGEDPQFRYYQWDGQHLLVVEQADRGRSALGISLRGAGHSQFGDLLVSEADIHAAGFVELSEEEAYELAESLPQTLPDESIGSHYHYSEFLLRKALVAQVAMELAARGNQGQQGLSISEVDSYERAIQRRWRVQADTCWFDLGLSGSQLIILVSAEGEVE